MRTAKSAIPVIIPWSGDGDGSGEEGKFMLFPSSGGINGPAMRHETVFWIARCLWGVRFIPSNHAIRDSTQKSGEIKKIIAWGLRSIGNAESGFTEYLR
jgi:hypothetical protein